MDEALDALVGRESPSNTKRSREEETFRLGM